MSANGNQGLPGSIDFLPEGCNVTEDDILIKSSVQGLYEFSERYAEIHGYVSAIVCTFGFMANLANIVCLTRRNMISPTNLILTWLAVADMLTMMSYFPFALHFYILRDRDIPRLHTRSYGWIVLLLFHANFTIVTHTIAIGLTIALAIFRYIYICFPIRGSELCSIKRSKQTILIVHLSTIVVCIPNYILNTIEESPPTGHVYRYVPTRSNLSELSNVSSIPSQEYSYKIGTSSYMFSHIIQTINNWVQAILIKLVPCVTLTILTIMLIVVMHKAYKKRMKLKSQGRKDESDRHGEHNRTTGMLLAVVMLFLLTELPQGILTLLSSFIDNFFPCVYMPLGDVLDIMALCNNAINFVLYCTMSRQFRETFVATFFNCCPQRPGWLKLKLITATQSSNTATTVNNHSNNTKTTNV
ncbi:G-protein coupled receptor dmsr-1 [Octopus bimaculoides]|nr:G-protein coupled receptor dmsr-1 [Octopus bimaculoides]XP_014769350.1 G-protein coupled receptor dmsr-1 [Octopus bimaculoides]XP_052828827.1 G-protein coupled receptor dmsr-1 [Octopus bimaculoides]|eukprot:XP_014769347.1 PREDICTED: sex peptide receptor-like [Octopus bimaculoides]